MRDPIAGRPGFALAVGVLWLGAMLSVPAAMAADGADERGERERIGPAVLPSLGQRTVLVTGSIGGCGWRADTATSRIASSRTGLLLTTGDHAHPRGTARQFRACHAPTWGPLLRRIRPVPGLRDHATPGASGYFGYFGRRAGPPGRGYYAFDLGAWRIYALDSECPGEAGCGPGSAQYRWLAADLATHPRRCVMASLHEPLFSSGRSGGRSATRPLIGLLFRAGTEIVVNGRDRMYERFAPARPWGAIDADHGIRQFIVGTGGAPLQEPGPDRPAHSEVSRGSSHGLLKLVLGAGVFRWRFVAVGGAFSDRGVGRCHEGPTAHAEPGRTIGS